jgi:hypothetical protein
MMVVTGSGGRPRAHSASSIKLHQVLQQLQPSSTSATPSAGAYKNGHVGNKSQKHYIGAASKKLSYSSPELRSMLVGLETTVPQNLNPPTQLGSRHKPYKKRRKIGGSRSSLYQVRLTIDGFSFFFFFFSLLARCCC